MNLQDRAQRNTAHLDLALDFSHSIQGIHFQRPYLVIEDLHFTVLERRDPLGCYAPSFALQQSRQDLSGQARTGSCSPLNALDSETKGLRMDWEECKLHGL